jgi:hypothetical protein
MRANLRRAVLVCVMVVSMLALAGIPARAHFEVGGNCHINEVRGNGTVVLRISNRTNDDHYVDCILRTSGGGDGTNLWSVERFVLGRHFRIVRAHLPGSWQTVRIVHVHVR